ncbi:hypothetical protein F9K33_02210 [bacterium]|nr:MAG: hypothetical protein F9K33_02210 [bacterium]
MKINTETFKLTEPGSFGRNALIVGAAGLALSAAGYVMDSKQFFHSYLVAFTFWTSIGLGGLFFTLLNHLVGSEWSIVLRRISETIMVTLPIMLVFFVPIIFGFHDLYHWSHADVVDADPILKAKAGYLNPMFFVIRTVIYFAIWFIFGRMLYNMSIKQDGGDQSNSERMRRISAPGMILFAFTATYAAFDWLMSLQPHWFSTIFGVWYFAGGLLTALAFINLFAQVLRKNEVLNNQITIEHYHDIGKLKFAFTIFWAYIAFSQFFLIWYANIPEETIFYLDRWEGSWQSVSLMLIYGHLMLPFLWLIPRATKRSLPAMAFIGVWLLLMHWVDLYWSVFPNLHEHGFQLSWMDLTTMLGIGGIFIWAMWVRFSKNALIPVKDPKLDKSLHFANP